jgi:hypothetical protein
VTYLGRQKPGINLSSHSSAVPAPPNSRSPELAAPPRRSRAIGPGSSLPGAAKGPCRPLKRREPKRDQRARSFALVVALATLLEREGIPASSRLVFRIALAAGAAPFRRASGLLWLGERRYGPRKLPPRTAAERSRRILIAVFKALERVDGRGRGMVARARRAARVKGGAAFDDHDAVTWLRRFVRPGADGRTENLRQYRAARDSLRGAQGPKPGTDPHTDI